MGDCIRRPFVFPTCVGVNRWVWADRGGKRRIPHVRGGEPVDKEVREVKHRVFPTCVGVNRCLGRAGRDRGRIPHVRGGEPIDPGVPAAEREYSPRAWG